jgi:hypothetical protein
MTPFNAQYNRSTSPQLERSKKIAIAASIRR